MNPFDKILLKTPKTSRYDQHNTNKLSMPAGKIVPIWWKDITPNEQIKLNLSTLVKTAPMVAPIYDRLKLETFAFFVPYRLIWSGAEDFFNLSTPVADRPSMPQILGAFGPDSIWVNNTVHYHTEDQRGDLMDYLGYPIFQNYFDYYMQLIIDQNDVFEFDPTYNIADQQDVLRGNPVVVDSFTCKPLTDPTTATDYAYNFDYDPTASGANPIWKFPTWLVTKVISKMYPGESILDFQPSLVGINSYSDLIELLPQIGFSNEQEAYNAWKRYVFGEFISKYNTGSYIAFNPDFANFFAQDSAGLKYRNALKRSSLPKRAYWRCIADWFINTNFEDPATYENYYLTDYSYIVNPAAYHLADRYWENDYFTSAFASTQSGSEVPIPVNGYIRDLRNANALQKVMERVLYNGRRYIDQIFGIFGAKSSDTRLDRCEVLGKSDFVFGIEEITQMSETNADNPLGSYAGRGVTAGKDSMFHYHAEEHGMIMILACIKPLASYIGVQDRLLFKTSPYDFLIPQFAQIGEQEIFVDELQQKLPTSNNDIGAVFGYQRRFAEYMFKHNEVHGDFSGNMDYWTMARKFDTIPVLNTDFLKITASDNLNRAFAVPSAKNHYYCYFNFEFKDVNAIPRYINYDL